MQLDDRCGKLRSVESLNAAAQEPLNMLSLQSIEERNKKGNVDF